MRRSRGLTRFACVAAVGVTLLAGVAGCGSDSGSGGGATSAGTGAASSGSSVSIKNFSFAPATLTVRAGTAVTFVNQDGAAHTVTADDRSFDSMNLDQGKSFMYTFGKVGTVKYHCSLHPYMTATVTVTN